MKTPKNFFHDRLVLLLLSVQAFVVALTTILILLRLDIASGDNYIVQYRSNLGLGAFQSGGSSTFFAFIIFSIFTLVSYTILSMRIYEMKRDYAIAILIFGLITVIFGLVVSNALLVLR